MPLNFFDDVFLLHFTFEAGARRFQAVRLPALSLQSINSTSKLAWSDNWSFAVSTEQVKWELYKNLQSSKTNAANGLSWRVLT